MAHTLNVLFCVCVFEMMHDVLPTRDTGIDLEETNGADPFLITLDAVGIGALVIERDGRVVESNSVFRSSQIAARLSLLNGWLRSQDKVVDTILLGLTDQSLRTLRSSRGIPHLGLRLVLHRNTETNETGRAMLTVHESGKHERAATFSRSEARVLDLIAQGNNLREISALTDTSYNTLRKQMQSMLVRYSARTQAHLLALYLTGNLTPPQSET